MFHLFYTLFSHHQNRLRYKYWERFHINMSRDGFKDKATRVLWRIMIVRITLFYTSNVSCFSLRFQLIRHWILHPRGEHHHIQLISTSYIESHTMSTHSSWSTACLGVSFSCMLFVLLVGFSCFVARRGFVPHLITYMVGWVNYTTCQFSCQYSSQFKLNLSVPWARDSLKLLILTCPNPINLLFSL